jgi:hydroxyacylglutathione hydrolase
MPLTSHSLRVGPLENNAYLIVCDATREAAVVDVGFEPEIVLAEIRRLGLSVRYLLSTHAHYDHVAGMRAVQQAVGGEYWIHPADQPLLDVLDQQGEMIGFPPAQPPGPAHDLFDGQMLQLGEEKLEVIHTPGHSPGGVAFRCNGDLWGGDTLFAGSVGRTDLPGGNFSQLARAIRTRLFTLGDDVRVHTGHGPDTTIGDEKRFNPFVGLEANLA